MNEFETRINAMRLQCKAERMQIQQDCDEIFARLNAAIAASDDPAVRRALRAEKNRAYLDTRRSLRWSMRCYRQQLDCLTDQYRLHLEHTPSGRAARKAMELLYYYAKATGQTSLALAFGDHKFGEITFR